MQEDVRFTQRLMTQRPHPCVPSAVRRPPHVPQDSRLDPVVAGASQHWDIRCCLFWRGEKGLSKGPEATTQGWCHILLKHKASPDLTSDVLRSSTYDTRYDAYIEEGQKPPWNKWPNCYCPLRLPLVPRAGYAHALAFSLLEYPSLMKHARPVSSFRPQSDCWALSVVEKVPSAAASGHFSLLDRSPQPHSERWGLLVPHLSSLDCPGGKMQRTRNQNFFLTATVNQ